MHQSVAIRHTIMITLVSHSHVSLESPTQPAEERSGRVPRCSNQWRRRADCRRARRASSSNLRYVEQYARDSLAVDVSERYRERFVTGQATLQIGGPELRWENSKEMRLGVRVVWHMRDTARHLRIFGMFYAVLRNRSSSATLCTWSPSPDLLWPDRDGVTWRELDLA